MVACQLNAWVDTTIFSTWLDKVWFRTYNFRNISDSILYMNSAPSHLTEEILKKFDENKSKYRLISPGLTSYYQPLVLCINKPFKDLIKKNIE